MLAGRLVGSLAARRLGSLAVFGFVFGFWVRVRVFGERVFGCVPVFAVFGGCFTVVFGSVRLPFLIL